MTKQQFGELVRASQEEFYRVAKTLLYSDDDCADAVSEAIVKALSKLSTLRDDRYAKTWFIRILINECYAIHRRCRRFSPMEFEPEKAYERDEQAYSDLYEALFRLPEDMRLAVTLYYLEGYSVRETALILKKTENVIKKKLMQARKRLKEELSEGMTVVGVREVTV